MSDNSFPNARAVEMAIKAAALSAQAIDPSRQVNDLIRQCHLDRFLCRVFADDSSSGWMLKGGTGLLARVPNSRRTIDADVANSALDVGDAVEELRRLARLDLGDHFRFQYRSRGPILETESQPYTLGQRVTFDAYLGSKQLDPIRVDVTSGPPLGSNAAVTMPANRLAIGRLVVHPYRLYPLVNQLADKVCASMTTFRGEPSSREKDLVDLVDLVIIARTQIIAAPEARGALLATLRQRRLPIPRQFQVPQQWGQRYVRLALGTPAARVGAREARTLVGRLVDPLLDGSATGWWQPASQRWG